MLHFFTGFHPEYHRPSDDFETVNVPGIRQVTGMATDLVLRWATSDAVPKARGDDLSVEDLADETVPRPAPSKQQKARLGVQVAAQAGVTGLVVQSVLLESPAAKAQIRVGDVIQQVSGAEMNRPEELIKAIAEWSPEAPITAVIRRGDALMEFEIQLDQKR